MNLVKLVFIHLHDEQNSLGSWPQRASILDGERDKMSKWTKRKERKKKKCEKHPWENYVSKVESK